MLCECLNKMRKILRGHLNKLKKKNGQHHGKKIKTERQNKITKHNIEATD